MLHSLLSRCARVWTRSSWLVLLLPCLGGTLAWGWSSSPQPMVAVPNLPTLAFDQYLVDLREVLPSDEIRAHFVFTNTGTKPLKITKLEPSCGCLQPQLRKDSLEPGEMGAFMLRVKTALQQPGPKTFTVRVLYNDSEPREETVELRVVFPMQQVYVRPMSLTFHQNSESPVSQEIVLTDLRSDSVSLLGVKTTSDYLTAEILTEDKSPEGATYCKVRVTVSGDVPVGRHQGQVVLVTDDLQFHELAVPVRILKSAAESTPPQVASPPVYGPALR